MKEERGNRFDEAMMAAAAQLREREESGSDSGASLGSVPAEVQEEEGILGRVKRALELKRGGLALPDYDRELLLLRDAASEEKLSDDQAMLIEQMDRVASIAATRAQYEPATIDPENPYFAHLKLTSEAISRRDILLGKRTFVRGDVCIVDWRHAPISRVFYRYGQGDAFVEEIAGREIHGEVIARRVVTIVDGQLVRVNTGEEAHIKTHLGWKKVSPQPATSLHGGAGLSARPDTTHPLPPLLGQSGSAREHRFDKHLPEISALLDAEQFELLTGDPNSMLVVAGVAGSGKTTVALHRLAYLAFQDPARFRPKRMMVMVFGAGLARYISKVLPALGVEGVPVAQLNLWAGAQKHRHFPKLPRYVVTQTPAVVVRFKTHRILVPMLEEAARASPKAEPSALFDELFTDRGWLRDGVTRYAPGAFTDEELRVVHRWCTDLHFQRVEKRMSEEDEPPGYDEEDSMILLRLYQLLVGRLRFSHKRGLSYDHLLVDEAQDFSPIELTVLMQIVRQGSITFAGDPAQKITDNDFSDWTEVLRTMGQEHVRVNPLRVSYRSTRQIMELAQAVLGPLAPTESIVTPREGDPVSYLRFGSVGAAMTFLGDTLTDLTRREPSASVAVLTRTGSQADEVFQDLHRADLPTLARVREQNFSFAPGIEVTDVAQTKGLEFDYVVLLYVDRENYPAADSFRHLLHVGITRAIHQLWLIGWDNTSPLLPDWVTPVLAG